MDIEVQSPLTQLPAYELLHKYLKIPNEVAQDVQPLGSFGAISLFNRLDLFRLEADVLYKGVEFPIGKQLVDDGQRLGVLLCCLELIQCLLGESKLLMNSFVLRC